MTFYYTCKKNHINHHVTEPLSQFTWPLPNNATGFVYVTLEAVPPYTGQSVPEMECLAEFRLDGKMTSVVDISKLGIVVVASIDASQTLTEKIGFVELQRDNLPAGTVDVAILAVLADAGQPLAEVAS